MASSFQCLLSSRRFSDSTNRLSLRNLNSYNDGSVTLFWPGLKTVKSTKSLRLYATLDGNNEHDLRNIYEITREKIKKAAMVLQVEAVFAQKQLFKEEHVGYSEGELVKATLNGAQTPVRVEIAEAALQLGAKKLSLLVHEAYKDAHNNTIQSMRNKMSNISADLGVEDEDFRDEIF